MNVNQYFASYENYFWQWEENGTVVAIPESSTIAYKDLVSSILEQLKLQGFPSFGSLLLAITAVNPNGVRSLQEIENILRKHINITSDEYISDAMAFLYLLTGLPDQYKTGERKMLVFRAIFRNCHNVTSAKRADHIATGFNDSNNISYQIATFNLDNRAINNDLKPLALLHRKFTTVQQILDVIIDLPELEVPIELEETPNPEDPETDEDFIDAMINDHRLFKVGSLVRMMWSGIHLPFHSSTPTQQKIGGVSDLTNKGNFDQLLISEYANEDIVFLSRLANNEALYLSRESPPSTNDMKRVILIDVSLKNWGTPKTVAFATMVAIAKHPKTDISCEAYIVGNNVTPIDVTSLDSLINGFQIVEGCLDGAEGIRKYFEEDPDAKNREVFIITETNTQKHASMIKVMSEFREQIAYWIFNDDEGGIDIYKELKSSRRHLQHLQLPLEQLWSKQPKKQAPHRDEKTDHFPILFQRAQGHLAYFTTENDEIFQVTKEKSLLRLYNKSSRYYESGWELFHQNLPFTNKDFAMGLHSNGDYYFLAYSTQNKDITIVNLRNGESKKVDFPQWKHRRNQSFVFSNDYFLHFNYNSSWQIDMEGNITKNQYHFSELKNLFTDHDKKVEDIRRRFYSTPGIFKNVKNICINTEGRIVLNDLHELQLNSGQHLKLDRNKYHSKILAENPENNVFTFHNGSSIEINPNGVMILKNHKPNTLDVYIPLVPQTSLAMATELHFAGNNFYRFDPLYELTLIDAGKEKIKAIQILKNHLIIGLKMGKEIVNMENKILPCFLKFDDAEKLKDELESIGAKVEVRKVSSKMYEQESWSTERFYKQHIQSFIDDILAWN